MKINFYLRAFDEYGFLVSMLKVVISDMRFFLSYYLMIMIVLAFIFQILTIDFENNQFFGNFMAYLIMSFRFSLGDFTDVDSFENGTEEWVVRLRWTYWIFSVILSSLIFLNFIIAVVSESYEKVMEIKTPSIYKEKAQMIQEREELMTEAELEDQKNFPRYLIVRKSQNSKTENTSWSGVSGEIKQDIQKNNKLLIQKINANNSAVLEKISEIKAIVDVLREERKTN